ncbi:TetR/AcrR family transcriptional regulator [Pectobacterium sp. B1J-3]|uniref:TetR/AcrR family transcriptional regulator n=1 Tax=Pectobacterium sp. B1J-3 TaxID=3385371 RepID=UPI0039065673
MGRHKVINPATILDAAEQIVRTQGIAALTIDAVAKSAGITKGGVQSSFGTKDALIDAMYKRWEGEFDVMTSSLMGGDTSPQARIRAHIDVTRQADAVECDRAAGMMAALLKMPDYLLKSKNWYATRLAGLDLNTQEGREARLAFLASEGIFMLRSFGFMAVDDETWQDVFDDITAMMPNPSSRV